MTNGLQTISRSGGLAAILLLSAAMLVGQQPPPPQPPPPGEQAPQQLLSPQQLDSLVAPIALYPDSLLSQVLVASTYPQEVSDAGQWLNQNRGLQGQQLVDAAQQQNWDPSIQALMVFPDVIGRLSADIRWTTDLGNAFLAQQADVMAAVQRLRAQAMQAGQLQSNAQQVVSTDYEDGQQAIEIAPANPEVVYVPYYNPAYIWGPAAWYYPDWCDFGFGFGFGPGIYINAYFGGLGWGGWGWGCNWFHGGFLYNRPYFFAHYGFHGFVGGRAWGNYNVWSHNANHRLGVAYPNNALNSRYGAISNSGRALNNNRFTTQPVARSYQALGRNGAAQPGGGWRHFNGTPATGSRSNAALGARNAYRPGSSFAPNTAGRQASPATGYHSNAAVGARNAYRPGSSFAPNTGVRQSNGWSHFNGTPATGYHSNAAVGARNAYRPSTPTPSNFGASRYGSSYGRGYTAPSYRPSPSYGRSYNAPAYRSSPSYSRSYSAPAYRPSPSYSRSYSAPAYRSSPSYGSRSFSAPSYRPSAPAYHAAPSFSHSYSAPRSFGGGGSFHGGGGGGGAHYSGGSSFHGGGGGGGGTHYSGGSSFHGGGGGGGGSHSSGGRR